MILRWPLFAVFLTCAVASCQGGGEDTQASDTSSSSGATSSSSSSSTRDPPDPPPELPPLPAVEGVTPFEDLNPDPTILEVNLVAKSNTVAILPGSKTKVLNYNDQLPGPMLH